MRSKVLLSVLACVLFLSPVAQAGRAAAPDVIDRILAIVSGGLILQSDVRAAIALGLVAVPAQADPIQSALDRLIERRLMLIEVDRYGPPEPAQAEIVAALGEVDTRVGSGERMAAILRESGFTLEQLRLYVRDDLRIRAYLQQRFGSALMVTEEDFVAYFQAHEREFTTGGVLRPFADVREEVRRALLAERRSVLVREWLAGLRRRADVNVLYLPPR